MYNKRIPKFSILSNKDSNRKKGLKLPTNLHNTKTTKTFQRPGIKTNNNSLPKTTLLALSVSEVSTFLTALVYTLTEYIVHKYFFSYYFYAMRDM